MARNNARFGKIRTVAAADTTDPAAPTNANGSPVTTLPAGVVRIDGAFGVVVDVIPHTTGHGTVGLLFWNEAARAWVHDSNASPTFVSVASVNGRFTWGQQYLIATAYVFPYVTSLTGTIDVYLGAIDQAGGA